MAEAYDDELITHDEIRDMIASRVHDVATEEDIEQAVSYTHLDVYKRQPLRAPFTGTHVS